MDIPNEIEEKFLKWAKTQNNIEAIIQIGSRAQPKAIVDEWSDWDYQLLCKSIKPYLKYDWTKVFNYPCWCTYIRRTSRNAIKITFVFEGAYEVELVLLVAWQIKLIYFLMAYPAWHSELPAALRKGIYDLCSIQKDGCKLLKGDDSWERRLQRSRNLLLPYMIEENFAEAVAAFWREAIWTFKQIARGDFRSAQRSFHLSLREVTYELLAMEGKKKSLPARDQARGAERWLEANRLAQTDQATEPNKKILVSALLNEIKLFAELSKTVANLYHFKLSDYGMITNWLIQQCTTLQQKT